MFVQKLYGFVDCGVFLKRYHVSDHEFLYVQGLSILPSYVSILWCGKKGYGFQLLLLCKVSEKQSESCGKDSRLMANSEN